MASFNFKMTISSSSIEPVTIALLVNPARIMQRAVTSLYTDLPVLAFKVFEFSGEGELPAVVQFDSGFDAYLSGHTFRNTTTAASALPIHISPSREFEVRPASNGSFSLIPVLEGFKSSGNKPVTITNLTQEFQTLGLADKFGNPYFLLEARPHNSVQLLPELEFAIVIVSDRLQAGQPFSGHAARHFYTFLASEVQSNVAVAGNVTVFYDGTDITVTTSNEAKPPLMHPVTEKPFVVVDLPDKPPAITATSTSANTQNATPPSPPAATSAATSASTLADTPAVTSALTPATTPAVTSTSTPATTPAVTSTSTPATTPAVTVAATPAVISTLTPASSTTPAVTVAAIASSTAVTPPKST